MNKWLFHQNGFARTSLSATVTRMDKTGLLSLSDQNQANALEASASRFIDDVLNIDNPYFKQKINQIYQAELQLYKANSSDTGAPFLSPPFRRKTGIKERTFQDNEINFNDDSEHEQDS